MITSCVKIGGYKFFSKLKLRFKPMVAKLFRQPLQHVDFGSFDLDVMLKLRHNVLRKTEKLFWKD